jgi:hypothetical protein
MEPTRQGLPQAQPFPDDSSPCINPNKPHIIRLIRMAMIPMPIPVCCYKMRLPLWEIIRLTKYQILPSKALEVKALTRLLRPLRSPLPLQYLGSEQAHQHTRQDLTFEHSTVQYHLNSLLRIPLLRRVTLRSLVPLAAADSKAHRSSPQQTSNSHVHLSMPDHGTTIFHN